MTKVNCYGTGSRVAMNSSIPQDPTYVIHIPLCNMTLHNFPHETAESLRRKWNDLL